MTLNLTGKADGMPNRCPITGEATTIPASTRLLAAPTKPEQPN
jgi:hypothetical protein